MLKKILIAALAIIILLAVLGYVFLNSFKPNYEESIQLARLTGTVETHYDAYGIPHIQADNEKDAFRTMGYIHAKERLWQMELLRRIAPGTLSEILGVELIETDRFFKMLGISYYSKESLDYFNKGMPEEVREPILAYLDGINQYIDINGGSLEHKILGVTPNPFSPLDVYNIMGYMAFSFCIAHETDPIATYIHDKLGPEYLNDLDLHVDPNTTLIRSGIGTTGLEDLSIHMDQLLDDLPAPQLIGSNSWVISGDKTKSGKVIFANDPHMGFSSPSVWFEAEISTPTLSFYGYFLAGYPFPQLMHNDHHAIGLTMFENDDVDFYTYQVNPTNPNQYVYKGSMLDFDVRQDVIKVKASDNITVETKSTVHGPVMNGVVDAISTDNPISLYWTFLKLPTRSIEGSYYMSKAKSMAEVKAAAGKIHAPGLNVMYGDTEGNVAWWASASLIRRPAHVNSKLILDGSSGDDDPLGFYEFEDNPMAENPDWGYVYSANNQSVADTFLHPGYYLPEDRARRIVHLLDAKDDWTVADVQKMMLDVTSMNSAEVAQSFVASVDRESLSEEEKPILDILQNWDGEFSLTNKAPLIYNKLIYNVAKMCMGDELGDDLFPIFNGTHLMKRSLQPLFANEDSPWWDDLSTKNIVENRSDVITSAFRTGVVQLQTQLGYDRDKWTWGQAHTLEHEHSFTAVGGFIRKKFNVGPYGVPGNNETINNYLYKWTESGNYHVVAGPSTRRVIDFNDVAESSWSILPTGQSGNVMSPYYRDQAEMYINGDFRKMWMGESSISKYTVHKSTFSPK